ncbi:MAG: NUDIX hydrolase [Alicyclobacillus shizuokensis]|nr:NUDIX hydrolase [Alicyclobacillus shizuokensis]
MADDRSYPARPYLAVSAAIVRDDRVLVVRRARHPARGVFTLPGGVVEAGETLKQAVVREVKEETGLAVEPIGLAGHREVVVRDAEGRVERHFVILAFAARWVAGEPQPSEEVAEARWLRLAESVLTAAGVAASALFCAEHGHQVRGPVDQHFSTSAYPVAAVDYLIQHGRTRRLLNAYDWGGYLIYRGIPTFVDGRTDVFLASGVFDDYLALQNVWWQCPELLDKYRFETALFPPGDSIVTYLESQPDWRIAYQDGTAVVLVHQSSTSSAKG